MEKHGNKIYVEYVTRQREKNYLASFFMYTIVQGKRCYVERHIGSKRIHDVMDKWERKGFTVYYTDERTELNLI